MPGTAYQSRDFVLEAEAAVQSPERQKDQPSLRLQVAQINFRQPLISQLASCRLQLEG